MWLLKLHFSISILCLITFIGFRSVFRDSIKENGWLDKETKPKTSGIGYLMFFVPLMNILCIVLTLMMITTKKQDFDKKCEELKHDDNSN